GRSGAGKTMGESYSRTISYYMDRQIVEKQPQLRKMHVKRIYAPDDPQTFIDVARIDEIADQLSPGESAASTTFKWLDGTTENNNPRRVTKKLTVANPDNQAQTVDLYTVDSLVLKNSDAVSTVAFKNNPADGSSPPPNTKRKTTSVRVPYNGLAGFDMSNPVDWKDYQAAMLAGTQDYSQYVDVEFVQTYYLHGAGEPTQISAVTIKNQILQKFFRAAPSGVDGVRTDPLQMIVNVGWNNDFAIGFGYSTEYDQTLVWIKADPYGVPIMSKTVVAFAEAGLPAIWESFLNPENQLTSDIYDQNCPVLAAALDFQGVTIASAASASPPPQQPSALDNALYVNVIPTSNPYTLTAIPVTSPAFFDRSGNPLAAYAAPPSAGVGNRIYADSAVSVFATSAAITFEDPQGNVLATARDGYYFAAKAINGEIVALIGQHSAPGKINQGPTTVLHYGLTGGLNARHALPLTQTYGADFDADLNVYILGYANTGLTTFAASISKYDIDANLVWQRDVSPALVVDTYGVASKYSPLTWLYLGQIVCIGQSLVTFKATFHALNAEGSGTLVDHALAVFAQADGSQGADIFWGSSQDWEITAYGNPYNSNIEPFMRMPVGLIRRPALPPG
ncbi:MAG: hypothetical protein KGL35_17270, partial [Bradyrhizobium sp.]|nr:hypothetical protein [Bradyrhizobium sp.]